MKMEKLSDKLLVVKDGMSDVDETMKDDKKIVNINKDVKRI
jgi:hypothetical protein